MALGKQIKVVLTLDDAGFSQKILGATRQTNNMETGFNKLATSTESLERIIAGLGKQLTSFGGGFETMQRQLVSSIAATNKAAASVKNLEQATASNAKTNESAAQKSIASRIKALEAETTTNAQLIAKRRQYIDQLTNLEREYEARALGQRVKADQIRAQKKAGSAATANNELRIGAGYSNSAQVIREEIAATQRLLNVKASEATVNQRKIEQLRQELNIVTQVGEANRRAVEAARAGAGQQAEIIRQQTQARREADRQMVNSAREAAQERVRVSREAAVEERRQAQMVADMWKGMAQMYVSTKIGEGLNKSLGQADDYNRVLERVDSFGLDGSAGRERVLSVAKNVEAANPNMSRTDVLKLTMSAVAGAVSTDTKMLNTIVPEIAKMMTVMTRQFPEQAHNLEDFGRNVMGVMEARGIVDNPKKMLETLDGLSRALISTQGKMSVQDYETISRRGGAGNSLFKNNESILYDIAAASQLKVMGGGSGGGGGGVSSFANMQKQAALRAQGGVREKMDGLKNQVEFGIIDGEALKLANNGKVPTARYSTVRYANSGDADKNFTKFAMDLVNSVKTKLAALPETDMRFFNPGDNRKDDNVLASAFGRFADKTWQNTSAREFYKMFATEAAQHRVTAEVGAAEAAPTYGESHTKSMESWGVSVDKTKAALVDLGNVVGNQLIPVLQPLLQTVTDIIRSMTEFGQGNPMAAKLAAIGAAAIGVTLSFRAMSGIYGTVTTVSNGLQALAGSSARAAGASTTLAGSAYRVSQAQMATLTSAARATAAQRDFANMQLQAAQKTVANTSGMQRLTAVTNTLVPAQNNARIAATNAATAQAALQRAQAASTIGARALSGTMMLLGGPIGMIITGLTVAITAWSMFGNAASEAQKKAKAASEGSATAVQNTIKRLRDDIVTMKKGEDAPIVDEERGEIAKLKANLQLKQKLRNDLNGSSERNDGAELARVARVQRLDKELIEEKKAIETREAALDEMSTLSVQRAHERAEREKKEAAEIEERIKKQLAAGAKFKIPTVDDDESATHDISDVFGKPGKEEKSKRDYIDPLDRALQETKGRVAAGKVALSTLKVNAEELADIRAEVEEELEGKRKGGIFNKDRDKNKQVAKNDPRYQALVEETFQLRLQGEQKKALEFANQRVAATTTEVDMAMERLADNGVERQSEAFRALVRELERAEVRLGAGAKGFDEWAVAKTRALGAQAQVDAVNMAADYQNSNRNDRAGLADTERARQTAALAAAADTEDRKYRLRMDTLNRTEAAEMEALARSNANEDEKIATLARYASARDVLEMQYGERRRVRAEQDARTLETALQKQTREWQDTGSQIESIGAGAANSFVSMLVNSLGAGRLAVGDFVKGVLTDIASAKLKQTLAQPMENLAGQGMDWIAENVFGIDAAAKAAEASASASRTTADTMAATATGAMSSIINSQVVPALMLMAQSAAQSSGASLGAGIGGMFASGASSGAASDSVANVMFANGGIMTEFGEMQLRKYAKGGIANQPQVAIYGEGAQNEAFVPLPDGRSIPVTMSGGQQSAPTNVQVNVINQTSQSVNAQQGQMRFDGKQMILDVVLSAATTPGSFRSGMKDAMK